MAQKQMKPFRGIDGEEVVPGNSVLYADGDVARRGEVIGVNTNGEALINTGKDGDPPYAEEVVRLLKFEGEMPTINQIHQVVDLNHIKDDEGLFSD